MFKFFNKQPPKAQEKDPQNVIERLKKLKEKLKKVQKYAAWGAIGLAATGGVVVAGAIGGMSVAMLVGACAAVAAAPIATAGAAIPTVVKDVIDLKIKSLRKKMSLSQKMASKGMKTTEAILIEQLNEVEKATDKYDLYTREGYSGVKDVKKDMDNAIRKKNVYSKAAKRANEEGKEKTVQRLMNISLQHDVDVKTPAWFAVGQAATTAIFRGQYKAMTSDPWVYWTETPYVKAALIVSALATGYECVKTAVHTIEAIKEKKAAKKAFKILENYGNGR